MSVFSGVGVKMEAEVVGDSEMTYVEPKIEPNLLLSTKTNTIKLMRDRDVDQRMRKRCKKSEARSHNLIID